MSERLKSQWRDRLREVAKRWGVTDPDIASAYLESYFKHCAFKSANPFSKSFEHDFGQFCNESVSDSLPAFVEVKSNIFWRKRAREIEAELARRFDSLAAARWRKMLETLDFGSQTDYDEDELETLHAIFEIIVETVPKSDVEFWSCLLWQDERISASAVYSPAGSVFADPRIRAAGPFLVSTCPCN